MKRRVLKTLFALTLCLAVVLTGQPAAALTFPCEILDKAGDLLPVLLLEEPLFSVNDGKLVRLDEVKSQFTGEPIAYDKAALVDVDGDGVLEAVLVFPLFEADVDYLVLDSLEGQVTGYELVARAMIDLKSDGSFVYASGAMDNGIGMLAFDGQEHQIIPVSWSETGPDGGALYFVDGQPAAEKEFHRRLSLQSQKPDAPWQALTADVMTETTQGD